MLPKLIRSANRLQALIRISLLRAQGIEIGSNVALHPGVVIERYSGIFQLGSDSQIGQGVHLITYGDSSLTLGSQVILRPNCFFISNGALAIGDNAFFNIGCFIGAADHVTIGKNTLFGPHVSITDNDHALSHGDDPIAAQPVTTSPVVIGDGAWLASNVSVTKGVTIGKGAVIGANAVVTHDIPEYAIAVGIPAKVLRYRD